MSKKSLFKKSNPEPVFVLSTPRSFTSVFCAMLGEHPQHYGVAELNLFNFDTLQEFWDKTADVNKVFQRHGLLRTVAELFYGEQTVLSVYNAKKWLKKRMDCDTGDVYKELCDYLAPRCVIDKSPAYTTTLENIERINRAFPKARYIHLTRNPLPQCKSFIKIFGRYAPIAGISMDTVSNPPRFDPQIDWFNRHRRVLNFLHQIPSERQIRIKGEDIVNNTNFTLEKISGWMQSDFDQASLNSMLHPENSPYAMSGPPGANAGNDPLFIKSPKFKPGTIKDVAINGALPWRRDGRGFHKRVIELAEEFGYGLNEDLLYDDYEIGSLFVE